MWKNDSYPTTEMYIVYIDKLVRLYYSGTAGHKNFSQEI